MKLSIHNQALLRGILAGAVVLSGASACSRSDRAGAGRDTTQSGATALTPSDSQASPSAPQLSAGPARQPSGDTATTTVRDTARATAQTRRPHQRTAPSSRRARQDTTITSGEAAVSGYREMERHTSAQPDTLAASGNRADSTGVSSDSSASAAAADSTSPEMAGTGAATPLDSAGVTSDYALTTDSTTAGYSEMARDTSPAAGRGDTAAVAVADSTTPAQSNTAGIKVQVDTTTAQAQADTTPAVHPDSLTVATSDSADTTEAAGAAPVANAVTGIDAVSLMSRAGARCVVKDDSSDVWWDMADSPAALNPCGTGTMTLSLVKTGEK